MKRTMKGVGLTEILVALLVLSIGVLGVISLQTIAKKNTFESLQRTTATTLARSIVARMRANKSEEALNVYADWSSRIDEYKFKNNNNQKQGKKNKSQSGSNQLNKKIVNCYKSNCSPTQIANFDLRQIKDMLKGVSTQSDDGLDAGGLIRPTVCILRSAQSNNGSGIYNIVIVWRGMTTRKLYSLKKTGESGDTNIMANRNAVHSCTNRLSMYETTNRDSRNKAKRTYRRSLVLRTYIAAND